MTAENITPYDMQLHFFLKTVNTYQIHELPKIFIMKSWFVYVLDLMLG